MMSKTESKKTFVITRVFNAPRELVFKTQSELKHLKNWWGPKGFTFVKCELDFREGGSFFYSMKSPEGHEMHGKITYYEIKFPEKIVSVVSFTDSKGTPIRHPLSKTWPLEVLNEMTLTENNGETTLTITGRPINANEEEENTYYSAFEGMNQGFKGTFDQLEAYLESLNL